MQTRVFDQRSSRPEIGAIDWDANDLQLRRDAQPALVVPWEKVRLSEGWGGRRKAELPSGLTLEFEDHSDFDAIRNRHGGFWAPLEQQLGRSKRQFVRWGVCLLATGGVIGVLIYLGLSRIVVHLVPDSVLVAVSDQVLAEVSTPSFTKHAFIQEMEARIRPLAPNLHFHVVVRSSRSTANAFALPDRRIVLTDEIIALSPSESGLYGVLLHELGHLHAQHPQKRFSQLVVQAFWQAFSERFVGTEGGLAAAGIRLASLAYSRREELEADAFAAKGLRLLGLSVEGFRQILRAIHTQATASQGGRGSEFLSTHPGLEERLTRLGG